MPHNVRFTGDGSAAYVTLQGGAGHAGIDVSLNGKYVFTGAIADNIPVTAADKIVVIDAETLQISKEYNVGSFPFWGGR